MDLIFEKIKFPLTDLQICPYRQRCLSLMNTQNLSATFCFPTDIAILINRLIFYFLIQGKFIWIHCGGTGRLAGSCK